MIEIFDFLDKIGKYIQLYGAWGLCVLLVIVFLIIYYLLTSSNEKQVSNLTEILEKRNNQLISLIEGCSTVISNSSLIMKEYHQIIQNNNLSISKINDDKKILEELIKKTNMIIELKIK